ncbi:MAG: hypothetical protein JWM27_51 [Gemmatimonadetes bacterium]|nr:hypothetical protein [Gemmatimonadota bacterium]
MPAARAFGTIRGVHGNTMGRMGLHASAAKMEGRAGTECALEAGRRGGHGGGRGLWIVIQSTTT